MLFVLFNRFTFPSTKETWETKLLGLVTMAPFLRHLPIFKKAMNYAVVEVRKFLGEQADFHCCYCADFCKICKSQCGGACKIEYFSVSRLCIYTKI